MDSESCGQLFNLTSFTLGGSQLCSWHCTRERCNVLKPCAGWQRCACPKQCDTWKVDFSRRKREFRELAVQILLYGLSGWSVGMFRALAKAGRD